MAASLLAIALLPASLRNPVRRGDPRDLDKVVLDALNAARDSLINPALQRSIPDPMALPPGAGGGSDTKSICIVPNPFGGCICHADAHYSVAIDTVSGAARGTITNFTSAHLSAANLTAYSLAISATLQAYGLHASGNGDNAQAGVSACGISPTVYGTAASDADASTVSLSMTATAVVDKARGCLKLSVTKAAVLSDELSMYNIKVDIDLGLFPLPVSAFFELFKDHISAAVAGAIKDPIGAAIPDAINPVLPCVPL